MDHVTSGPDAHETIVVVPEEPLGTPGGRTRARRMRVRWRRISRRGSRTLVVAGVIRSNQLRLGTHTLALAAQQVICTLPLLMAVSALARRYHSGGIVGLLSDVLQLDDRSRRALGTLFATRSTVDLDPLLLELATGILFLGGVAATTQDMLETVWQVSQTRGTRLVRQLVWVLASAPCLAVAVLGGRYAHHLPVGTNIALPTAALVEGVVGFVFYWWTQHLLLGGQVSWRTLAPGSVLSGVGMSLATIASALILPGQLVEQVDYYGPIGAAMVLSLWLYAVTIVVVAAALAGAMLDERREEQRRNRRGGDGHAVLDEPVRDGGALPRG